MIQVAYEQQIHSAIARKVAYLHKRGYVFDFVFSGADSVVCLQDNVSFFIEHIVLNEIYQAYDVISHVYKLIYTVETCCGYSGLIMKDTICKEELLF